MQYFGHRTQAGRKRRLVPWCGILLLAQACSGSDSTPAAQGAAGAGAFSGAQTPVAGTQPGTAMSPAAVPTAGASMPVATAGGMATGVAGPAGTNSGTPTAGTAGATPTDPSAASPDGMTPTDPSAGEGTATAPGADEWVRMAYDLGSTYHNPNETTITRENAANLEIAWRADMGDNVYGVPIQVGDKIYASTGQVVQAMNAADGERLWRNTRTGTTGSMSYDNGTLYVHTNDGEIEALDAETGDQKWISAAGPTKGDGSSSPIVAGDKVLIGGSGGGQEISTGGFRGWISALNKETGASVWSTFTVPDNAFGASIWSTVSPNLEEGIVYATTGNNHGPPATDSSDSFLAFDLESGEIKWKSQRTANDTWSLRSPGSPDADFGANPVQYEMMVDGTLTPMLAAGQKSGDIHGVRRSDGMLVWTRSLGGGAADGSRGVFVNTSWSGDGKVLAAHNNGGRATLYGLDGATGDIAWMTNLGGSVWGRISSIKGVGFVGAGTELVIFDSNTGEIIKTIPSARGSVTGTISIAQGRVAYGEGMSWSSALPGQTLTVLTVQ